MPKLLSDEGKLHYDIELLNLGNHDKALDILNKIAPSYSSYENANIVKAFAYNSKGKGKSNSGDEGNVYQQAPGFLESILTLPTEALALQCFLLAFCIYYNLEDYNKARNISQQTGVFRDKKYQNILASTSRFLLAVPQSA